MTSVVRAVRFLSVVPVPVPMWVVVVPAMIAMHSFVFVSPVVAHPAEGHGHSSEHFDQLLLASADSSVRWATVRHDDAADVTPPDRGHADCPGPSHPCEEAGHGWHPCVGVPIAGVDLDLAAAVESAAEADPAGVLGPAHRGPRVGGQAPPWTVLSAAELSIWRV